MTLVIDELYPGVVFEQTFRIQKTVSIGHVRPWIYKHGTPTGTMTLEVYSDGVKINEASLTASTINAAISGTYAHGPLRFDFDSLPLHHDSTSQYTEFTLKLFVTGHTKDTDNFFGAVRQYEAPVYDYYGSGTDPDDGSLLNSMVAPLGFELYKVGY